MAYCKQCGAKLDDDARFCPECGTKIPSSVENTVQPSREYKEQNSGEYIDLSDFGYGKRKMGQPREQVQTSSATAMKEPSFFMKLFWTIVVAIPIVLLAYITQDFHSHEENQTFQYLDSGKDWTDRIGEIIDFFSNLFK